MNTISWILNELNYQRNLALSQVAEPIDTNNPVLRNHPDLMELEVAIRAAVDTDLVCINRVINLVYDLGLPGDAEMPKPMPEAYVTAWYAMEAAGRECYRLSTACVSLTEAKMAVR